MTFVLAFCGFFGGKGSDGLGDWVVVLVGCAVFGKQCACGATRGWRGDRVACGDYMLFLFCHAGGFGAFGATYCLWLLMENNAPAALHMVGGDTGSPAATTCFFFVLPCGWFGACGATYCWLAR